MSLITVKNVVVLNNPAPFLSPFQFEITFDCLEPGIKEELEWKLVYVASSADSSLDQELDSIVVGPIAVGRNKFVYQVDPPDASKIPTKCLRGVTCILLTCSYREQEFIRIGYYVHNQFEGEEYKESYADLAEGDETDDHTGAAAEEEDDDDMQEQDYEMGMDEVDVTSSGTESGRSRTGSRPSSPSMPGTPRSSSSLIEEKTAVSSLPPLSKLVRFIIADKPVVTRFQIAWDDHINSAITVSDGATTAMGAMHSSTNPSTGTTTDTATLANPYAFGHKLIDGNTNSNSRHSTMDVDS